MNHASCQPSVAVAFLVSILVVALGLAGCSQPPAAPAAAIAEVAVITVQHERVVLTSELPGRTCGYRVAEIRPQVNGLVQKRLFTEGSDVYVGQVLYQIDAAPYQADFDKATATLAVAENEVKRARAAIDASHAHVKRQQAELKLAKLVLARCEILVKTNAVTVMECDRAETAVDVALAAIEAAESQVTSDQQAISVAEAAAQQAKSAVETARINLSYTTITAPIAGHIGRSSVTEGAIVTAYQPAALATIQQFDPIYVDVPQSTAELHRLKRILAGGQVKEDGTDSVKIFLEDGAEYPLKGSLEFRDVTVDPTTGSVIVRIVVPNPDGLLLPGMFVRALVEEGARDDAILIPQMAVSRDPKGSPQALVVAADGKVQQRQLTTDRAIGNKWLVSAGLAPGEQVIVEGMQRVRPGAAVRAVPAAAPPAEPASTAAAQAAPNLN